MNKRQRKKRIKKFADHFSELLTKHYEANIEFYVAVRKLFAPNIKELK